MQKHERGELIKNVLMFLLLGGFIATCFVLPNFAQVAKLFRPRNARERQRVNKALERMKERRLIEIKFKNGVKTFGLTKSGRALALRYKIEKIKINIPAKWDGWWTMVIFDIPESRKGDRNMLSYRLKEMGFYPLQKSTFIAPCVCKKEIDTIANYLEVREHVLCARVRSIDNEKELLSHFHLKNR
ncbi:MAG: hypothetical protein HZA25_03215 [Candidatus Niyogibacteria bacterium]|nr:hypothetical protein [Candidatus Niyogibacteria bacterium]